MLKDLLILNCKTHELPIKELQSSGDGVSFMINGKNFSFANWQIVGDLKHLSKLVMKTINTAK